MNQEKEKKSKIVKKDAAEMVTAKFVVCQDFCEVSGNHIHLKGAITLVDANIGEEIRMRVDKRLLL